MPDLTSDLRSEDQEDTTVNEKNAAELNLGAESRDGVSPEPEVGKEVISPKRRWFALSIFMLALFIDVACGSAFFVFLGQIIIDINIVFEQSTWVINSYTATFASCLMLFGRIVDLYPPGPIFIIGFACVGILNLIISFITDPYAFLILRAIAGIAASSVVPSAYKIIGSIFPPEQRGKAYTLYTMTGSIANVTGVILAGVISLIGTGGQGRNWRWFFRIVAGCCIPAVVGAWLVIPKNVAVPAKTDNRFKRMDIPGILLMLTSILLLVVALTLGATYGWNQAKFIAPLIVSIILFPLFFLWEARIPTEYALVPPAIWRIPNFTVLIIYSLFILGWWGVNFIPYVQLYHEVHEESLILAAVRTLPEGVIAGIVSVVLVIYPQWTAKPRWPIVGCTLLAVTALIIWCNTPDITGVGYWRYVFPGMVIGSGANQISLLATIVAVMQTVPEEQIGVGSAILSTGMQISTVLALAIQAGFLTIYPGGLSDWRNVRASWYFEAGWGLLWCLGIAVLYRPSKSKGGKEICGHAV